VVEILKSYSEKRGRARNAARLAFIDILSKKESYGRNYYTVKVDQLSHNLRELQDNLIIGLGEKNMRIFNRNYVGQS
jgi:hypothetical protein